MTYIRSDLYVKTSLKENFVYQLEILAHYLSVYLCCFCTYNKVVLVFVPKKENVGYYSFSMLFYDN